MVGRRCDGKCRQCYAGPVSLMRWDFSSRLRRLDDAFQSDGVSCGWTPNDLELCRLLIKEVVMMDMRQGVVVLTSILMVTLLASSCVAELPESEAADHGDVTVAAHRERGASKLMPTQTGEVHWAV